MMAPGWFLEDSLESNNLEHGLGEQGWPELSVVGRPRQECPPLPPALPLPLTTLPLFHQVGELIVDCHLSPCTLSQRNDFLNNLPRCHEARSTVLRSIFTTATLHLCVRLEGHACNTFAPHAHPHTLTPPLLTPPHPHPHPHTPTPPLLTLTPPHPHSHTHHPEQSDAVFPSRIDLRGCGTLGVWLDVFPRPPPPHPLTLHTSTGDAVTQPPQSTQLADHPLHELHVGVRV